MMKYEGASVSSNMKKKTSRASETKLAHTAPPRRGAPAGDDEVRGDERELEHEEEHEQVERDEAAHHRRLQEEDPGEVHPSVLAVAPEHDDQREQQRSEEHQEDGD